MRFDRDALDLRRRLIVGFDLLSQGLEQGVHLTGGALGPSAEAYRLRMQAFESN